jgi:hypothetical protein
MEKELSSVSNVMEMGRILSFSPDVKTLTAATSTISRQSLISHIVVFMHTYTQVLSCIYSNLVLLQHQDDYQFIIVPSHLSHNHKGLTEFPPPPPFSLLAYRKQGQYYQ